MARNQVPSEVLYPFPEGRDTWGDHEVPADPHWRPRRRSEGDSSGASGVEPIFHWPERLHQQKPMNEYQAVMECAPGDQEKTDVSALLDMRELLADAIDGLPEREREVFEAVFIRGETLQAIGDRMGFSKMHASRIRDRAIGMLRQMLSGHPLVTEYLKVNDDDEG